MNQLQTGATHAAEPQEDSYGTRKRMAFIEETIRAGNPSGILDVGCGVGLVSLELAARFPDLRIIAIDDDRATIEYARSRNPHGKLKFQINHELDVGQHFDLVIASEVLEHVDDPEKFLEWIRERLSERGRVVLTVPNGYGPFELMSCAQGVLQCLGIYAVLRALRRRFRRAPAVEASTPVTLAASPHVNFFSCRALRRLFRRSGFEVVRFRSRTFLCGFLLDRFIHTRRLIAWNAAVADKLPAAFSSDWMFLLHRSTADKAVAPVKRGWYGRFHRYINRRCFEQG
ncbi:MAG TPA: class I SAM-dependent methyltransferase [Burkholderiales bacterium]|nr:class I SAM-dependent methyltransferase [Burkholderiales bacterium]